MIAGLIEVAQANPMLVAGVGTVVTGSLLYLIRGIPLWCLAALKRMLTVELTLNSENPLYYELLALLSAHRIALFARHFAADRGGGIVSGFGPSVAIFRGRPVLFARSLMENKLHLQEQITLTLFSRNTALLAAMVDEARRPTGQDHIKVSLSGFGGYWNAPVPRRKRALDTIFVPAGTKEAIVGKIRWFLANEAWYLARGIPYKLVFLLHGEPGTGKTSLIYGVASEFSRGLCAVSSSVNAIDRLLRETPDNSFVVIEDIDMLSISREKNESAAPAPDAPAAGTPPQRKPDDEQELSALHVLINVLDGLATPHGLIVFITTNHRDRLDPALIRPGRVDVDLEIGRLGPAETEAMFVAFYGEGARPLIASYTGSNSFRPRTGAELQVLFVAATAEEAARRFRTGERPDSRGEPRRFSSFSRVDAVRPLEQRL